MNRKIIGKSNYILRKVLNQPQNISIINDFIEAILGIEIKKATLHPYLERISAHLPSEENFGIADLRILTKENEEFNIGIQFVDGYYIQNKMLLYYAQIHANQLEYEGQNKVVRTITINILNFDYFNTKEFHKIIRLKENSSEKKITEELELHVIELAKFRKLKNKIENKKDAWVAYLEGNNAKLVNEAIKEEKIKELDKELDKYWESETME